MGADSSFSIMARKIESNSKKGLSEVMELDLKSNDIHFKTPSAK